MQGCITNRGASSHWEIQPFWTLNMFQEMKEKHIHEVMHGGKKHTQHNTLRQEKNVLLLGIRT